MKINLHFAFFVKTNLVNYCQGIEKNAVHQHLLPDRLVNTSLPTIDEAELKCS
jgi:hypothetical protein